MTDTAPTTPTEASTATLEFVHSGIIRFHFPTRASSGDDPETKVVRVRRPFLGELKQIRIAYADMQEKVSQEATRVVAAGNELKAEVEQLAKQLADGEISIEDHAERVAEVKERDRSSARAMDDFRETETLAWWSDHVFPTLALDPVPDVMEYPAWIVDARLPGKVLNHWRTVPTGPG